MYRLLIGVIFSTMLAVFGVDAASGAEILMKLAHYAPPGIANSDEDAMAQVFKSIVEKASLERVKVEVYPAAQLGNVRETAEATKLGVVQGNIIFTSLGGAFSPKIWLIGIPYIFPDQYHAWQVLDGDFGRELAEAVRKETGLRVLAWGEGDGFRQVFNSVKPVQKVADLKGMKIRVPESKGLLAMFQAYGALPVTVTWTETYTALQTKVADGAEPEIGSAKNIKMNEVQKYLLLTNHSYNTHLLWVNDKWFSGLPADIQSIMLEAARIAKVANRGLSVIRTYMFLQEFEKQGMQVAAPSPQAVEEFKRIGQPAYIAAIEKEIGKEWVQKMLKAAKDAEEKIKAENRRATSKR